MSSDEQRKMARKDAKAYNRGFFIVMGLILLVAGAIAVYAFMNWGVLIGKLENSDNTVIQLLMNAQIIHHDI